MRTRLCDLLAIEHPILNAPMATVAGAQLAAAVSDGGGLGMIGGAFRGPAGLRSEIGDAKALTDRRVGVGFISHLPETEQLQAVALEAGVSVIAHSFADPTPFVDAAHAAGALVLSQIRTVAEAERSAAAGVDVIVAQGTESGGHTGRVSTLPSVPAVVDAVAPLPVIATGGIADARGIAAALMLGAEGVWLGTRFVATPESASIGTIRQERIVAASTDDTVLTETVDLAIRLPWPEGVAMRMLRNRFTDEWHGREDEIRAWSNERAAAFRTEGFREPEDGPVPAGEAVGLIESVEPAADIVRRLAVEVDALLASRPPLLLG